MRRTIAIGVVLIVCAELVGLFHPDRQVVGWLAGTVAAGVMVMLCLLVFRSTRIAVDDSRARDPAENLRRWLARTESMIARADTNRSDWDKHLRPLLARQFELATGQRKTKDADAFREAALTVFGKDLWPWVDPDQVLPNAHHEPGPGRATLGEILRRLENT